MYYEIKEFVSKLVSLSNTSPRATLHIRFLPVQFNNLKRGIMRKTWNRLYIWLKLGLIFSITFNTVTFANQYREQEEMRALIKQARDAWVARDAEALAQLFTPNGEIIVPGQRWQGQMKIREEVTRFAHHYSDVKIDIKRIIVEDNQASVEWDYEDTEKATSLRNKADDVIVVDFKDGRISRWREYFDTKTPVIP